MLYGEFINGTNCKDNEHNYKVYKDLEVMYMNSNLSKEEIYSYGKKLVDNSKSKEEIALEIAIQAEIEEEKKEVKYYLERAKFYREIMGDNTESKRFEKLAKEHKQRIKGLKFVLA